MSIVFFCQNCGGRFEVDQAAAGQRGKCRSCGEFVAIPKPSGVTGSPFRLSPEPAQSEVGRPVAPVDLAPAPVGWIEAVNSRVGLAPISSEGLRPAPIQRVALDALADVGGPADYALARSQSGAAIARVTPEIPSIPEGASRRQLHAVRKALRFIGNTSYLISLPFLFLVVLGAVLNNRPLAFFGAAIVVLLNAGRLVTGLFNLVLIPFRDGLGQGLLFLLPPFTFVYIAKHWARVKRPLLRIAEPAITVGLLIMAFVFVPTLNTGAPDGPLVDRVEAGTQALAREFKSEVANAKPVDLNALRDHAQAKLRAVEDRFRSRAEGDEAPDAGSAAADGSNTKAADRR